VSKLIKHIAQAALAALGVLFIRSMSTIEGGMRADTWEWSIFVDDVNMGVWDAKEGGDVDSDSSSYKPGGMAEQYSLGGSSTTENLTFRRNYRLGRDHPASQRLIDSAGKAKVRAVGQPLDHDGNAWGVPFTYSGTLKRVSFPDHDSTSTDPAMVEIEVTVTGKPTGMRR
jgi:hypothetical protein